ncbi:hypothetical protein QFC19_004468 [Naganishia cerealis]|uniref:Uncharacterized protein n=1 Tax=Naganishia cerealis TaxID=610337 RepID=A0ACC2VWB9_9TREE|nr:hypothetical protein QFC19_004468 [Naganishia cerealis]
MVDKGIQSSEIPEPARLVEGILRQTHDVALIRKYGLWLAKREPETALQVLTGQGMVASVKFDDRALLSDLKPINREAANKYLEYAVVRKRSADKSLHNALLAHYLDQCESFLSDDGVVYHFTEIYDEYVATRPGITYCQYIAETAHDSPAKTLRMKTILFLQGSPFYDLLEAEERLQGIDKLFYEKAIIYGRLGRHEKALQLLAIRMRDSVSAETYCSQGGVVVPPKIARTIGNKMADLEPWVALGEIGRRRKGTIEGEQRENLVLALLKVYMEDGSQAKKQTRDLLNAQALHLDTLQVSFYTDIVWFKLLMMPSEQVIDMIPPDWSVSSMSDFFTRAMKRQLHEKATWRVIKAISAGQNSAIAEEYARTVGRQPPTTEAGPTDSPSGYTLPDEGSIAVNEYGTMHEKFPLDKSESEDSSVAPNTMDGEMHCSRVSLNLVETSVHEVRLYAISYSASATRMLDFVNKRAVEYDRTIKVVHRRAEVLYISTCSPRYQIPLLRALYHTQSDNLSAYAPGMDTPSSAFYTHQYGNGQRRDSDSFEMPKIDMRDHDTSELIGDLSLTDGPAFNGGYDDSDLLGDESYDLEKYKAGIEEEHQPVETSGYVYDERSEGDETVMHDDVDVQRGTSTGMEPPNPPKATINDGSVETQRDERLRAALFELKKMNEVFENYASALEATRHHNERLAARTAQTSQLLDQYVSLLSQTEHTQRLILDKRWTGLNNDVQLAEEEERSRIEQEERRRREAEVARQRAAEVQAERERAREAKEKSATAAAIAAPTGVRSGMSRLGVGRGTRGSATSSIRGSTRGSRTGSAVGRTTSSTIPNPTGGTASSVIRKPSGTFTNVKSSGYGPPRTRQ